MKRKFKLLTSVASLCLAVALMAFGVYAATQPKVSITGSVTFKANNVFADVEVYKYVGASAIEANGEGWTRVGNTLSFNNTDYTDKTAAIGEMALNDTNLVAQYKIVVKNKFSAPATDKVYCKVAAPAAHINGLPTGVEYTPGTLEGEATATDFVFVGTYTVDPAAATFNAIDLEGTQVTISRAPIA